ncbi:MAG: hypothetical protein ABW096_04060 [Candidatus Thiodiazotropha sp.]
MTREQFKSIMILAIVFVVTVTLVVFAWNNQRLGDVEGKIYWSVINEVFPAREYPENLAFISMVTTCENPEYVRDSVPVSVTDNFIEANGPGGTPLRLSFCEGVVPVADWKSTKEVHDRNSARSIPGGKEIVSISRAGFNEERTKALICLKNLKDHHHRKSVFFYLEKKHETWKVINDYAI